MAKKEFKGLNDWRVSYEIGDAGLQVDVYEVATKDGETDYTWIVVDKGEQLEWLIEQLQAIQKGE